MWETLPAWGQIFESYCGSVIATMFIGSTLTGNVADAILLPVVIISIGLVASIAGILSMSLLKVANSAWALRIAPAISLLVLFTGAWFVVSNMNFGAAFSFRMGPFWAMTLGSLVGLFTGAAAEYYTSSKFSPVRKIVQASKTGPATNIIAGLAVGMYSCSNLF